VYERLGVRRAINGRGCFTLVGGSLLSPAVLAAYAEASQGFVLIEELQDAAGAAIARATGGEWGYVTSGAGAALVLATAACIARLDVDIFDRLPATAGIPSEVVVQETHRTSYDRLVRSAGGKLVAFGTARGSTHQEMQDAIGSATVAALYVVEAEAEGLGFDEFVEIAHGRGVPVIVDAAPSLPPASNLRRFTLGGADLVVFSGGKSIRGPQSTGFIAGRRDLLLSVALQHQDMDVSTATWTRRSLIDSAMISRRPGQGIGRSMKVGKEEIVALLVALEEYRQRDHEREYRDWSALATNLSERLDAVEGLDSWATGTHANGRRPVPSVFVQIDPDRFGRSGIEVVHEFQSHEPVIVLNDEAAAENLLVIDVENLRAPDIDTLVDAFRTVGVEQFYGGHLATELKG
jgi:L-seryl-tRNA(Ser) seleniumtransferase